MKKSFAIPSVICIAILSSASLQSRCDAKNKSHGHETKPDIYEPLSTDEDGALGLDVTVQATTITNAPTWDGDIEGKIISFTVKGHPVELAQKTIQHSNGKSWIVTRKFGNVEVAGAYGDHYTKPSTDLGSMREDMLPGNTVTVRYLSPINDWNGLCVWLTQSQKTRFKKLAASK